MLLGDVHFYHFSRDSWNPNTYPITRFLSETGIQGFPSLDSWLEVTQNVSALQFQSSLVQHREHYGGQLNVLEYVTYFHFINIMFVFRTYIRSNLPVPVTNNSLQQFVQMIYLSQINQAMTLKSISDVCRVHSSVKMIDPRTSEG